MLSIIIISPDKEVALFWESLDSATEANGVLSLPTDSFWLGVRDLGSKMVIRQCYNDIWNMIQHLQIKEGYRRVALLGNPGIGKSWFHFYLLYKLKKLGATVVFDWKILRHSYLFTSTGTTKADEFPELGLHDTWYLVDSKPPPLVKAFTVLTTSPRRENWRDFLKMPYAVPRWMPVWSPDEIEMCRSVFYPTLSQAKVQQLYDKWGGIPRYVLEKANVPAIQDSFARAIADAKLDNLIHSIGETNSDDDVSHKLVHMVVNGNYDGYHMNWASTSVARLCAEKFERECQRELRQFLARSEGLGPLGALRGHLFEGFAHNILQLGGTFDIRSLEKGTTSQLQLAPTTERTIFRYSDLRSLTHNDYGRPLAKNFESVDAVIAPNMAFQITVNKHHGIKTNGVIKLHNELQALQNPIQPLQVYFVVPQEVFADFPKQSFKDQDDKNTAKPPEYVHQYVLKIQLTL